MTKYEYFPIGMWGVCVWWCECVVVCGVGCVGRVGTCEGVWGRVGACGDMWGRVQAVGEKKYRSPLYYPDTLVYPDTCLGAFVKPF